MLQRCVVWGGPGIPRVGRVGFYLESTCAVNVPVRPAPGRAARATRVFRVIFKGSFGCALSRAVRVRVHARVACRRLREVGSL